MQISRSMLVTLGILVWTFSSAQVPPGFSSISEGGGVKVYRKTYSGWAPDYVVVAEMQNGGLVHSLTGPFSGAPYALVQKATFADFCGAAGMLNDANHNAAVVVNGTHFENVILEATHLSFGLKRNGSTISYGVDNVVAANYDRVRTLCYDGLTSGLFHHSTETFNASRWPNVIGGRAWYFPVFDNKWMQRNLVGLRDTDGNGTPETLLFFVSKQASKGWAIDKLVEFGCEQNNIMQLDSGDSTGLWIDGKTHIVPGWWRHIPHAIAIYRRTTTDASSFVADITVPDGTVFLPSQSFQKVWRIRNTGTSTWGSGYQWVFDGGSSLSGPASINVPTVNPNGTWDPTVNLVAPTSQGVYRGYWRMQAPNGQKFGTRVWVEIRVDVGMTYVSESNAAPYNGATGFWKWGTPGYWWRRSTPGLDGGMYYTYNNDSSHGIDNMGDWRPNLPQSRNYEVFVHIPENYATTRDAHYEVYHANGRTDRIVNQYIWYNEWVSLGTYFFNAGTGGFLRLIDLTNETYATKKIGFDAAKWEPR